MSSLDDTYELMGQFKQRLEGFNTQLDESMRELRQWHEMLDRDWPADQTKQRYTDLVGPLDQFVANYVSHTGPAFESFISGQYQALGAFLQEN
jgi:hypothetical protein